MFTFFILMLAGLVCWSIVSNDRKSSRSKIDVSSASYRQGYWDGVRAAEHGVKTPELSLQTAVSSHQSHENAMNGASALDITHPAASVKAPPHMSHNPSLPVDTVPVTRVDTHPTINIALYVATLLLVSGIILLAQTVGLDNWLRFVLVWLLIGACYIAGLVLEKRAPIVKPAAIAFVGTALAGVPVAGVTMYLLVSRDAALCWLVTSLIGSAMFVYATVRLKSQLLAYISLLSLFVLSCTLPAVAHAQIVWYYVVMIAFGAALTALARLHVPLISPEFAKPIKNASPIAVPIALIGSVFSFAVMNAAEYSAVIVAAIIFYAVYAVTAESENERTVAAIVARVLTFAGAVSIAAWIGHDSRVAMSSSLAATGIANVVASAAYMRSRERRLSSHEVLAWAGFIVSTLIAPGMVADLYTGGHAAVMAIELGGVFITSIFVAWYTHRYEFLWPAALTTFFLPGLVGEYIAEPRFDATVYFLIPVALILGALLARLLRLHRPLGVNGTILMYATIVVWMLMALLPALTLGGWWLAGWCAMVALTGYYVVAVESVIPFAIVAHGFLLMALGQALSTFHVPQGMIYVTLAWVSAAISLSAYEYAKRRKERWWHELGESALIALVGYATLVGVACLLALGHTAQQTEQVFAWMPLVGALYFVAYRLKAAALLYAGNVASVVLVFLLCRWARVPYQTIPLYIAWFGLIGFYGFGRIYRVVTGGLSVWTVMLVSAAATTIVAGVIGAFSGSHEAMIGSGFALIGIGAALCYDDYEFKRLQFLDVGMILAVFGLERIIAVMAPGLNFLWYTHIWALLAFGLAAVYYAEKRRDDGVARLILGLCLITLPGFWAAMTSGGQYQLLFLVEHVIIVLAGLVKAQRLSTIWGALGVTVSMLYMLRGFQALLNIAIGLMVISAVVYAIVHADRRSKRADK